MRQLERMGSAIKKCALWANANRGDYALLYVIEGMFGSEYDFSPSFNLEKSQEETRRDLFIIPTLAAFQFINFLK
jgi:hypothetical protein